MPSSPAFLAEALPLGDLTAPPPARSQAARAYLDVVRAAAAEFHAAGAGGRAVALALAAAVDRLVRGLFEAAHARHRAALAAPVALAATGGYGRGELCPFSDVDLLFLYPGAPDETLAALTEEVLYPLWDARLDVGHAIRNVPDAIRLAREDLTVCTALLDTRLIGGDQDLFHGFVSGTYQALFTPDANDFIARLEDEVRTRRARFGETPYLLEPNLKNGDGGLRDLYVGLWAAKARFRVADFADLVRRGEATARQVAALTQARDFLLWVRTALHLHAGRRQDQLGFEAQEAIARRLFPAARPAEGDRRSPTTVAVEELMRRFYLAAKAVRREVARLLERCVVPPRRAPTTRRIDHSFMLFNGRLATTGPEVFREQPGEMVRLFAVALDRGVEIYGHTRDLVAETLGEAAPGRTPLTGDRAAGAHFLEVLRDPRDRRSPSVLEQMHDLGVLTALMPEWAPLTGRAQHDIYHVYTVDQHSLYAVACLKALGRAEAPWAKDHPNAVAAMASVAPRDRTALYLGTLLHDVGKPLGCGHSEKGARLALVIARRLGLEEADVRRVEFLVRQHLLLSHLSQRRDIDDTGMVAQLARTLGDPVALDQLYLLTFADMAMVAPGNLTQWKANLLRDLHGRTRAYLRSGPDLAGADTSARVQARKQRAARLLGGGADLDETFGRLPDRYFTQHPARTIVRHMQLCQRRAAEGRRVLIEVRHHSSRRYSVVTVCTEDAPGLLASIAGVFVAHRIDVHAAEINSRASAADEAGFVNGPGEALDIFTVHDRLGRAIRDAARWRAVQDDLGRVLGGEATIADVIAARRERSVLPQKVKPRVLTEVEIDNDVSVDFTVVDVYTQDRLGVLYTIARTLAEQGLDIHLSKVATEAERVGDIFYVRDRATRAKLTGPLRQEALRQALFAALDRLEREGI
jgi:[protein-PII] uridylyltransferase